MGRLIHASDWPFASNAGVFWNPLAPRQLLRPGAERNLFERDYRLWRGLGPPLEVFERAVTVFGA